MNTERTSIAKNDQAGFTLLELIISMVIFIIITGAIYGLMQLGMYDRNRASRRTDVLTNARVAVHMIGRDVLNAGLGYHRRGGIVPDNFNSTQLGVPADVDGNRDMLTSVVAGNGINTNSLNATPGLKTDMISFAYQDVDFNCGTPVQLQGVAAPSGLPTVSRLTFKASSVAAVGACPSPRTDQASLPTPYDLFLIESDTSQVVGMATAVSGTTSMDLAPGDPLGLNQAINGTGVNGSLLRQCTSSSDTNCTTYSATAKRIFLVSYEVKSDGTLIRTTYGNNRGGASTAQVQELPLAYNVEDMQIKYVLDDGTLSDNPSAGPDGIAGTADDDWQGFNKIRQVQVTVTVLSTEIDEKTHLPEAITLSSTFSTRNLEYDAG
ncbi:MAG: prepilin-type N-terminal cleavage/methylation domain-containing protein [Acidobacteria bacterium]|nr:prepilin-type N-terminal cleavage/methylation domain-containing protein [Acidobacteriota bacterium]